jgi:hypothetical protein
MGYDPFFLPKSRKVIQVTALFLNERYTIGAETMTAATALSKVAPGG